MEYADDYMQLIAQKIVKHKDNWKDNPNRYTSLFMIIVPLLKAEKRAEFNLMLRDFSINNYGMRPESAERICYTHFSQFMQGRKLFINSREKSISFSFDKIIRTEVDIIQLERGLRDLAFWLLVAFKQMLRGRAIKFDTTEAGISDIQVGAFATL